jgi:Domain of unknown function (DUF385).
MSGPALPTMLLTTKGRRSGKDRTVPLHYVRDGKNSSPLARTSG